MKIDVRKRPLEKGKIIPIKFDYVFVSIFNNPKNIVILENFISCYLDIPLEEVKGNLTINSRELELESKHTKNKQVDLILDLNGNKINIELNNTFGKGIIDRNIIYACNIHGRQLKYRDNSYSDITSLIQINLNATNKHFTDKLIESYSLCERENNQILSEKIRIDIINLLMCDKKCYTNREEKLARWCKILLSESEVELEEALGDDLMEEKAKDALVEEVDKYSRDDEVVALYSAYSREELERNTVLNEERQEARREGHEEGIKSSKIEITKNMIKENIDINIIQKVTNLSMEEIIKIKEEI